MASRGHRVIACAQSLLPSDPYDVSFPFSKTDSQYPGMDYCFCGLVSLEDPPKHGVREAIGTLRLAGIKVMMVTGDHPKTAEAIARKINLILGDTKESLAKKTGRPVEEIYEDEVDAVVIHGDDIDSLQGWQWDQSASSPCTMLVLLRVLTRLGTQFSPRTRLCSRARLLNISLRSVRTRLACVGLFEYSPSCSQTCTSTWPHCRSVSSLRCSE